MNLTDILTELEAGKISAIQAQSKLAMWKPVELDGVTYNPILTPQERIKWFLADLEKSIADNPQFNASVAFKVAKIWFKDEVEVINIGKQ